MNALVLTTLTLLFTQNPTEPPLSVAQVFGAAHHGDVGAGEVTWRSSLLLLVDHRSNDELLRVSFARPLPRDVVVTPATALSSIERDPEGNTIAVVARGADLAYGGTSASGTLRRLDVSARHPLARDDDRVMLQAPFVEGDAVQRVSLSAASPLRFTPDDALAMERRIGLSAGIDVNRDERHRLDRLLPLRESMGTERLYLRAGPALVDKGLVGTLERSPAQRTGVGLAAAAFFGLLVLIGALLYRRAANEAEMERVDAILEERFDALG